MSLPELPDRCQSGGALPGRRHLLEDLGHGNHALTSMDAHSAIFVTWDEGGYEDSAPFGPTDNSGCCDSPVLPATPADPTTAGGGDLVGGTLYGGGHVPMIVIAKMAPGGSQMRRLPTTTLSYRRSS